ncbi:unnamed protein product [Ixodes pacificus]
MSTALPSAAPFPHFKRIETLNRDEMRNTREKLKTLATFAGINFDSTSASKGWFRYLHLSVTNFIASATTAYDKRPHWCHLSEHYREGLRLVLSPWARSTLDTVMGNYSS